eukprot:comp20789_c0_seq2/m.42905 comp20789_c0_seq2/g.42905  ORF comp20789_c0_seq2/g.42905 comp20789_c0_seq2/m.42905 type:complete len:387 (-) comp20789_c0_seq2:602-1762(-)
MRMAVPGLATQHRSVHRIHHDHVLDRRIHDGREERLTIAAVVVVHPGIHIGQRRVDDIAPHRARARLGAKVVLDRVVVQCVRDRGVLVHIDGQIGELGPQVVHRLLVMIKRGRSVAHVLLIRHHVAHNIVLHRVCDLVPVCHRQELCNIVLKVLGHRVVLNPKVGRGIQIVAPIVVEHLVVDVVEGRARIVASGAEVVVIAGLVDPAHRSGVAATVRNPGLAQKGVETAEGRIVRVLTLLLGHDVAVLRRTEHLGVPQHNQNDQQQQRENRLADIRLALLELERPRTAHQRAHLARFAKLDLDRRRSRAASSRMSIISSRRWRQQRRRCLRGLRWHRCRPAARREQLEPRAVGTGCAVTMALADRDRLVVVALLEAAHVVVVVCCC